MDDIYSKTAKLKELLENDERVILLNKLEKQMDENEEVIALAYKKDMASVKYSEILNHFSEDSKEAKNALKELHLAKKELDSHPVVKQYLAAYKEVRLLYEEINNILFGNFNSNLCPKEK